MITVVISVIQRLQTIKDQISGYEGGAKSAQPAWDAYMKAVLEGVPEQPLTPPPGIVTVKIDRSTGQLANALATAAKSISSKVRSRHNKRCTGGYDHYR